jgi:hypothetical protein
MEGGIRRIGSRAVPGDDQAQMIKQQVELAPHKPAAMGNQQAKKPSALRQRGQQPRPVAPHPPIARSIPYAFEGKEQPKVTTSLGHKLAWGCLGTSFIVYPVEQLTDKVFRGHAVCSLSCKGVATLSLGTLHGSFQGLFKLAPLVSTRSTSDSRPHSTTR